MPINVGGIEVEIKLNNGQLVTGLIKNEELVKLTGQKIEGHMSRTSAKVSNAFSRMFGIGALIGMGIAAVRSLYKAIGDGIGRAIDKNAALKATLTNIQDNFSTMFMNIGMWLTPIIEKLTPFMNLIGQMAGQNILVQNANTLGKLDDLKKWTEYSFKNGQLDLKEYSKIMDQINAKYSILAQKAKVLADAERSRNIETLNNSTKTLLDSMSKLVPITSESAKKIQEWGGAILQSVQSIKDFKLDDIVSRQKELSTMLKTGFDPNGIKLTADELANVKKQLTEIQNVTAVGVLQVFVTLVDLGKQFAQAINDAISSSAINAQKMALAGVTAEVEKYENALNAMNKQIEWFKTQIETSEIGMEDTEENINIKIKNRKDLIEQNNEAAKTYSKTVSDAQAKYGSDLVGAKKNVDDQISNLGILKAQIDAMPDKVGIFGADNEMKKRAQLNYEMLKVQLETRKIEIQAAIDAQTALYKLDQSNATYRDEINKLEKQKTDLMNEQAEAAQATADAMKDQTRELLSQQAKLGLLDIENYGDALLALSQLQTAGYSGLDLLSAMSDLGFSNELSQSTRVGQIVVNNYMASNNSANIQAMLSNQFGA